MKSQEFSFQVSWSDEDEVFIAICPEFDGVSGFGETPAAALEEAQTALQLAIETYVDEGWALPEPRRTTSYSGQLRIRIPKGLHRNLALQAANEGVSLNTHIACVLAYREGQSGALDATKRWMYDFLLQTRQAWGYGGAANANSIPAPGRILTNPTLGWKHA